MILQPLEVRNGIRRSKELNATNTVWNQYNFGSRRAIGCMASLFRKAQTEYSENGGRGIMPFSFFENYYFYSGQQRKILMRKSDLSKNTLDYEYGRTMDDLADITTAFEGRLRESGFSVPIDDVFNYTYIRTLDESYIGFYREYKALYELRERFPIFSFEFPESSIDIKYSIDIAVYKDGKMIGGLQVKTLQYRRSVKDYSLDAKEYNKRNFDMCERDLGFRPEYLFVDYRGGLLEVPAFITKFKEV